MAIIKVLLVEDDPIVVEITREFLKADPDFIEVGVARTGSEAVELTAKLDPQLVLLDNYLPDFNGTMVIEKIRVLNNRIDFIVITAAREIPIVQECLRLGIRDYLIKPFLKQRFLQSLLNYKQFLKTLDQTEVSQADIDQINLNHQENTLPKGFSRLTRDKILEIVENQTNDGVTAEEIAGLAGISVVAARRYLKLLNENRAIECDLVYGKQGRPNYIYRRK